MDEPRSSSRCGNLNPSSQTIATIPPSPTRLTQAGIDVGRSWRTVSKTTRNTKTPAATPPTRARGDTHGTIRPATMRRNLALEAEEGLGHVFGTPPAHRTVRVTNVTEANGRM
jgi:hypothetical protein